MKIPTLSTLAKCLLLLIGVALIGWILYQGPWVREIVVSWVGKLGKPAIPFLRHALQDENRQVQKQARQALEVIGSDALPSIIESLRDADPQVRVQALKDMGVVARQAKSAVPLLITTYQNDPDINVRKRIVVLFGHIGGDAQDAIPVLLKALKDPDDNIRADAAESISIIGAKGDTGPIVAALIDTLGDNVPNVRAEAAEGLARFGLKAAGAVESLGKAAQDPDPNVRREAMEALGKINPRKK